MRSTVRLVLLIGVFALAWNLYDISHSITFGAQQLNVPHPPDAPPPGPPLPGEPADARPRRPDVPPDFQEDPKDSRPERRIVDPVKVKKDAEELAALAQKVQDEVGQLSKNLLSKDLDKDLKQIQKITKRLRGEITP